MPSIRTKTTISDVLALTAALAETQTLGTTYTSGFQTSWPAQESSYATALIEVRNTSVGTCTIGLYAPSDLASDTPYRVLDPASAATASELPTRVFGPFTRETLAVLEFRFSGAGTAIVGFQPVLEEGGAL